MRDDDPIVTSGGYYSRGPDGRLVRVSPGTPDVHICRRVADFPGGCLPTGAVLDACERCGVPVGRDPIRRGPIVCMQCARIHPLPIEES